MLEFLAANAATIVISLVLLAAVCLIVRKLVKDKKSGKGGCSCGGNCAACGACRSADKTVKASFKP